MFALLAISQREKAHLLHQHHDFVVFPKKLEELKKLDKPVAHFSPKEFKKAKRPEYLQKSFDPKDYFKQLKTISKIETNDQKKDNLVTAGSIMKMFQDQEYGTPQEIYILDEDDKYLDLDVQHQQTPFKSIHSSLASRVLEEENIRGTKYHVRHH